MLTGFEPQTSGTEKTALPTEPQPLSIHINSGPNFAF